MGHKRVVENVQTFSRPPADIFSLIPHDSEPVIFSTVKLPDKSILSFTAVKFEWGMSTQRSWYLTLINIFSMVCYHSAIFEKEIRVFVNLQLVTLPLWQHHGGGGDGAGMGVRCRVCSNCCLLGRRSEIGHRVRLAGRSAAHPKHFSLKTVSRNTTHWQPAGIYQPDSPCICGVKKQKTY